MPVDRNGLCAIGRIQTKDVLICGEEVRVRMISARERAEFIRQFADSKAGDAESRAAVLSACLVDSEGKQMFPDKDSILDLSADVVEKLFTECLDFNGFTSKVDDVAKNSESSPG